MTRITGTISLLLGLLLPVVMQAADGRRLLGEMAEDYRAAAGWELSIEQHFVWTLAEDSVTTFGRLWVSPRGAFALELGPARMIGDGHRLMRWEEGGQQVLLEDLRTGEDTLLPHRLLLQPEEFFRAGKTRPWVREEGREGLELELEPKGDSEFMRQASLLLSKAGRRWQAEELRFEDIGGNRHRYRILERRALATPDEDFLERLRFEPPAGMELVDLRGSESRQDAGADPAGEQ
jgi:hypothetical protein